MAMKDYSSLIEKVKNGDEEAFNIILEDHKRIIYKLIYSHQIENGDFMLDFESLVQEGNIALYKAVFSYEENKGMSFTSYAYMVLRARLNTVIRDEMKKYEDEHYSIDCCENIDYHIAMSNLTIAENPLTYHKELEFKKTLDEFISKLSYEDQQIIEMRSDNLSYKNISERLNINSKRIDNRLRVLRKKLKKYLEENEWFYMLMKPKMNNFL